MDTQNGRTTEQTELLAADLRPTGADGTDLRTEPWSGLRLVEPAADAFGGPAADAFAEAIGEAAGQAADEAVTGQDAEGADDPAWDYEDVILRSVN
ncbi:hypothetical protein [Kitasatospora fiedleri]|uniref:hypothetical protein n=1 Tax=Kitasatospora fiedleri TaxID=2991545 RepID=UPI00249A5F47|nr:hypothetical protein [Kitasatospora fiedleri]